MKKMHKGFGLVCHRAIREICKMVGITDIYAKVEGAINIQNITKAFFLGLLNQVRFGVSFFISVALLARVEM